MARIWVDILTPKQVYFFAELIRRLEAAGHEVIRTTRRYREVNELLELKRLEAIVIGEHGGRTLEGKLEASTKRIFELTKIVAEREPDVAISYSSPEAARTAFGLGIPHICVSDSPHAEAVCRLTIPLSKRLITPKIIPKNVWRKFGAGPQMIVQYDALDPVVWIKALSPDPKVLEDLNLDRTKPIIVFRHEEYFASYLLGTLNDKVPVLIPVIMDLVRRLEGAAQFVALTRYDRKVPAVPTALSRHLITPKAAVDGPSLLSYTSLFIGAGGTMTTEAALLGVPTISCYPGEPTLVEQHLIKHGLVNRITDPKQIVEKAIQILRLIDVNRKIQREKARTLTAKMEDPIEVIINTLVQYIQ